MSNDIILGIDTSNYTTSVAVMSVDGELIANIKRPLYVKDGERGLRQSDAVFSHIKNIPSAMQEAGLHIKGKNISAIGVSSRPRNIDGSYMPCFLSGVSVAEAVAASVGAPLYCFSHQCGHIMAAIYSSGCFELLDEDFAAFHVSGGTTEMLRVHPSADGFLAEHIGGTKDLNAGQIIDRVGVAMGLSFPCGPSIEEYALKNTSSIPKKKISRDGFFVNLSGLENMANDMLKKGADRPLVSAFVLDYIGNAIVQMSEAYVDKYGDCKFVYAGGVMCNSLIKEKLSKRFNCAFALPSMSADNAVGIAYLALRSYIGKNKE